MRRQSINITQFSHASPIPTASRIGNLVVSGFIRGTDTGTGKLAPSLDEQCALMFSHMQRCIELAGGSLDDIIKVNIWVETIDRNPINAEWIKWFSNPASRPARQMCVMEMEPDVLIQCDFMAVIG